MADVIPWLIKIEFEMCVLFLLIGTSLSIDEINKSESQPPRFPTIIASNRDEYFTTFSGELLGQDGKSVYRFLPTDMEGGGSWLGFDIPMKCKTRNMVGAFRFAVVLNYHDWRNALTSTSEKAFQHVNSSSHHSLSRGLLVKNYLTNCTSAKDYADSLVESINNYRPFNLIVGDESGVYYISTHHPVPRLLKEGTLYGFANGDELYEYSAVEPSVLSSLSSSEMEEESFVLGKWQKLSRGCRLMDERVVRPFLQALQLLSSQSTPSAIGHAQSPTIHQQQQLSAILRSVARDVCDEVLSDRTLLPDPSFGRESEAACQLGAIFVVPTIINNSVSSMASSSLPISTSSSGNLAEDVEKVRREMRQQILSSFRTVEKQDGNITFSSDDGTLFGTRTSTALVFVHPCGEIDHESCFALADRNFDSITQLWTARDIFLWWIFGSILDLLLKSKGMYL